MELRSLELFTKLKEYPSLSQAAQSLYISQPALSTLVKNMEKELDCILLDRMNEGIHFTPIGEVVYEKARDVLEHVEIIRSIPSDPLLDDGEHLSFATNFSRGSCFLAEAITRLQKNHVDFFAEMTFMKEELQQIIKLLSIEKLDFALVKIDFYEKEKIFQRLEAAQIKYHTLYQEDMHLIARKNHPLIQRKGIMFSDLKHYCCAIYENDFNLYLSHRLGKEFTLSDYLVLDDEISLWNYVSNTDSITVMSERELEIGQNLLGRDFVILDWDYFAWTRESVFLSNKTIAAEMTESYLHLLQDICM